MNSTLIRPIFGAERGYNAAADIVTQTADGRDLNAIWNEFGETLNVWNAGRQKLVDLLTYPVDNLIEDVPAVGGEDFEEASEFGEPKGIRPGVDFFSMGYDFKWYDLAARYTWKFLADAPANRIEANHQMALEADNRLVFRKVMKTLFDNTNRLASINGANYSVYSLYNGTDGAVPPTYRGNEFTSSHSHYLVSGAATLDSGDVEQLVDTISEHGFGPTEGSQIVILANKAQVDIIRSFTRNVANANDAVAKFDFIPSATQAGFLLPGQGLLGQTPPTTWNGMDVVGSYAGAYIIEDSYIPAGYLAAFATGGDASLKNPIGLREHANTGLRGLRLIGGNRQGYPLIDSYYQRGFGTGIRQRGAAAVLQVKASGAYEVPALYAKAI